METCDDVASLNTVGSRNLQFLKVGRMTISERSGHSKIFFFLVPKKKFTSSPGGPEITCPYRSRCFTFFIMINRTFYVRCSTCMSFSPLRKHTVILSIQVVERPSFKCRDRDRQIFVEQPRFFIHLWFLFTISCPPKNSLGSHLLQGNPKILCCWFVTGSVGGTRSDRSVGGVQFETWLNWQQWHPFSKIAWWVFIIFFKRTGFSQPFNQLVIPFPEIHQLQEVVRKTFHVGIGRWVWTNGRINQDTSRLLSRLPYVLHTFPTNQTIQT